jgi:hypothetical protein
MAVKQNFKANQAQIVKQNGKKRRTVVEKGNHKSLEKYADLKLNLSKKNSGNEWIWTTDQGLMSPLLYH